MLKQYHLYIKGDVIGVGFRAWTKIQAKIIGVTGWVRNNLSNPYIFGPGGGVEAVIQGSNDKTKAMIDIIKKGSPISRVDDVEISSQDPHEVFDGFVITK